MMWALALFLGMCTQGVWGYWEYVGNNGAWEVRSKHDTYPRFMLVDTKNPFPCIGNVPKVKLCAGSNSERPWSIDRGLKVAIFRAEDQECSFKVVDVKGLGVIADEACYELAVDFDVQRGDNFGFYWSNYGVVSYDWAPRNADDSPDVASRVIGDQNYCGANIGPPIANDVFNLTYGAMSAQDSHSYRDYAISFYICCDCHVIEPPVNLRPYPWAKHDTFRRFLQVDQRYPFVCDGKVTDIKLFSGSDSERSWADNERGLKFGIYRKLVGPLPPACNFEVKYLFGLGIIATEGIHEFHNLDISVDEGDNFGFFWANYGVVSFEWLTPRTESNNNYCGANVNPNGQDTVDLQWGDISSDESTGHRDYAIWVTYCC